MKSFVTDQFAGGEGWTADKFARALKEPLAEIGVEVERIAGHVQCGFLADGLSQQAHRSKHHEVAEIVGRVLEMGAPR